MDYWKNDKHTKEIVFLSMKHINDEPLRNGLIKAVLRGKGHLARIISEELSEAFPSNKEFKQIDNLITDKFFG